MADDRARARRELVEQIARLGGEPGSAESLRHLLGNAPGPAFLVRADGVVIEANDEAEALVGDGPDEIVGRPFHEIAERLGGYEYMPVAVGGGESLRLALFPPPEAKALARVLSGWSGQKERLLTAFIEHSSESCLLVDRNCTVLACNKVAAERLGIPAEELILNSLCERLDPEVARQRLEWLERALETGKVQRFEDERNGHVFVHTVIPLPDPDGVVRSAALIARDLTQARRAERAMVASLVERDRYRRDLEALFKAIPDSIFTVDRELRVRDANREPGEVCRLLAGANPGQPFTGCQEGCQGALAETLTTGGMVTEYRVDCPAQPGRVVVLTSAPLPGEPAGADAPGSEAGPAGAVLIVRDVSRLARLERSLRERSRLGGLIGQSSAMLRLFDLLARLAGMPTTVLILGESGTGKELAAEALHRLGPRAGKPLVKVNCSALSESLLESELFGHVKGAFTGADRDKVGRFSAAEGGTVFLDEIGDISPALQLKLLRFLESHEFEPVGSSRTVKADVRVVAATNADLAAKVAAGQFRADLYYRLRVMVVTMPPLRERPADIPLLTQHFLAEFGRAMHKNFTAPSLEVMDLLMRYPWPGNVRELRNALEHASILCPGGAIAPEHLPPELTGQVWPSPPAASSLPVAALPRPAGRARTGREAVAAALARARGNKSEAARLLGVDRRTVYRKIEEYGLDA